MSALQNCKADTSTQYAAHPFGKRSKLPPNPVQPQGRTPVELAPRGALEEDIVANIARLVLRKRNLATLLRAEDDFRLVEIGNIATAERLLSDLEMEGRLDALIDKCLKRLLFLRGLKSLPMGLFFSFVTAHCRAETHSGPNQSCVTARLG